MNLRAEELKAIFDVLSEDGHLKKGFGPDISWVKFFDVLDKINDRLETKG